MQAQVALTELQKHFLGGNWHVVDPLNQEQINAQIVYEIEKKIQKKIKTNKTKKVQTLNLIYKNKGEII